MPANKKFNPTNIPIIQNESVGIVRINKIPVSNWNKATNKFTHQRYNNLRVWIANAVVEILSRMKYRPKKLEIIQKLIIGLKNNTSPKIASNIPNTKFSG